MDTKNNYPKALRRLADFLEEHEGEFGGTTFNSNGHGSLDIHVHEYDDARDREVTRKITRALGGSWDKDPQPYAMMFQQNGVLGFFRATIFVDRESVCERKLVGVEEVERAAVEAQEARVESVPVYEWECLPLLAERELADA